MSKRTIIKQGGEIAPAKSASGIEIDGKTLEEIVGEQEAKELGEQLTPDRNIPGHSRKHYKSYARYEEHKEENGSGRVLTRREINAETWEKIMENETTIEGVIAALLLSGREVSGKEMQENCVRRVPGCTKKSYSTRSTYLYHKTDFGKFIISRRSGKGAAYKLVPAALELKSDELLYFVYKGNEKARDTILEHHKGLKPYLEESKKDDTDKLTTSVPQLSQPAVDNVLEVVKKAVSQSLGVEVNVSGRVEIVFKLGN